MLFKAELLRDGAQTAFSVRNVKEVKYDVRYQDDEVTISEKNIEDFEPFSAVGSIRIIADKASWSVISKDCMYVGLQHESI
ncbi:hypothetical protein M3M38_07270 [Fructilactobacillus cliffordii]|uniref:hypothetical protein n=1 Tax=Fructilactobacillus cliffordii TaxID=2940299 RepID=UPI0020932261|nr:hypothetical protein [Fructilactobacillus cliffordii]USS86459.1 hypothetical protein M3M38_07270 [Fructilactobacillus cliffordii]